MKAYSMSPDPYDSGVQKYATAEDIYEGLRLLAAGEEMAILGEMFPDVSYEGQDYYYIDKGGALKEKFDELSDYGNRIWEFDAAITLMGEWDVQDFIYDALHQDDLAKLLGFKKIFVEHLLKGDSKRYGEIAEAYAAKIRELRQNSFFEFQRVFQGIINAYHLPFFGVNPYNNFATAVRDKVQKKLKFPEQQLLIVECRSFLTSYDDFILGLQMTQEMYRQIERQYQAKHHALQASYESLVRQLLTAAADQGVDFRAIDTAALLGPGKESEALNG